MAIRKNKKGSELEVEDNKFKGVYQALRIFRKLSDEEAVVFIEILKRKKVSIENVKQILESKKLKITTTKPYTLIKNLENQNLIFEGKGNSQGKIYHAINPRDLLMDIGDAMKNLDNEVTLLESEEPEFIEEEVLEEPKILEKEYEITATIGNLISKKYDLEFYYDGHCVKENDMLYNRLIKRFSLKPQKGIFSAVFATKKGDQLFPYIAIIFSLTPTIENKTKLTGCKIINPEVCKCLRERCVK